MDVFTRGRGLSFVVNFAARMLLAIGKGLSSNAAGADARALAREERPAQVWSMCLLMVRWWADQLSPEETAAIENAFDGAGATVARSLSIVRDKLSTFVQATLDATDDIGLARAGGGFLYFLNNVGVARIKSALDSADVVTTLEKLTAKVPLSAELATVYTGLVASVADPARGGIQPTQQSRSERFDRADLRPSPPPAPRLEPRERLIATLVGKGYSEAEIANILRNPAGRSRT